MDTGGDGMCQEGFVWNSIRLKEFGFILDKETCEEMWIHKIKVQVQANETESFDGVGTEYSFDTQIKWSGKQPGSNHDVNVCTMQCIHFAKSASLDDDIMV